MAEPLITAAELAARLADRTPPVVLDATAHLGPPVGDERFPVRSGAPDWAAAHIPGSRHLDLVEEIAEPGAGYHFAAAGPVRLRAALTAAGVTDRSEVVCYDSTDGQWAARLWWVLRDAGVPARVLDGGLTAWRTAGLPVTGGGAEPAHAGGPGPEIDDGRHGWAEITEVAEISAGDTEGLLVCALPADQFTGAAPTRYPRPGHIPGSRNLPAGDLRGADGRYLPPEEIRRVAEPAVGAPGARPLTLYCGAGISAAGLALGLVAAGYDDVRIYDGSLEEWSADPARPLSAPAVDAGAAPGAG